MAVHLLRSKSRPPQKVLAVNNAFMYGVDFPVPGPQNVGRIEPGVRMREILNGPSWHRTSEERHNPDLPDCPYHCFSRAYISRFLHDAIDLFFYGVANINFLGQNSKTPFSIA